MAVQIINSAPSRYKARGPFSMKKKILISALICILSAVAFAYYLYYKPHQSIAGESAMYQLEASTLVNDYDNNEQAANEKYLGKIVEVRGVVAEKLKDEKGKINITLKGADLSGVGCEFDPKYQETIQEIKEGQEVKIKGICTGVLMDVVLVDCVCVPDVN
jgi:hypothetical protein